jgi:endonuclease-3
MPAPAPVRPTRLNRERAAKILDILEKTYPDADTELRYRNAYELVVATILSAQCTDKMVNEVTPALFEEFPDPASLARASERRVEALIRPTGFFRQKTKAIRGAARGVVDEFGGRVPADLEALVTLPGVGRKTASVVVGTAYGQPAVFVDTHVNRLANRLALTKNADPVAIEPELKSLLPAEQWTAFCHRLIHHGRQICYARTPRCSVCPLADVCPKVGVTKSS